jgi:regulator of nonsense transcripts 2
MLRHEFRNLFKKKDQINIESKVKNVRFIAELVKFNLYPKRDALDCLKSLLSDFTHHHIEMTCNLLEVCGRVLFKTPESSHQMRLILEQMMRKKMLLSVDSKYVTMIENAYYFTNPPEITRHVIEEPSIQTYIRYLLYDCLNRSTIDSVLSKIRKLNWSDRRLAKFTINCLIEAYNVKFYNIRYLAALLAALNKDHQWITIAVVDGVVEDILLMMEINEVQFNQRRIPMIRYFGELYNYRLSDSSIVLKILYTLITYGVEYPKPEQNLAQIQLSRLDPPDNLFRIKLVCDLLDTSGQYLSSSQDKKKLDCYLLFFQRYYWCKRHIFLMHPYCLARSSNQFPAATEYLYNDTIRNLRPAFKMANSYVNATQAFQEFIDSLQNEPRQSESS